MNPPSTTEEVIADLGKRRHCRIAATDKKADSLRGAIEADLLAVPVLSLHQVAAKNSLGLESLRRALVRWGYSLAALSVELKNRKIQTRNIHGAESDDAVLARIDDVVVRLEKEKPDTFTEICGELRICTSRMRKLMQRAGLDTKVIIKKAAAKRQKYILKSTEAARAVLALDVKRQKKERARILRATKKIQARAEKARAVSKKQRAIDALVSNPLGSRWV